jgi:hypothetical protein
MELTPLRYFRAIAQTRHMTRAAAQLGVTQPALSAMLKKLEKEVGTPLLHRAGRGVTLTEAGRVFLAHAEDSVRSAESAVRAVRQLLGLEYGLVSIGGGATAVSYILPPAVSEIRRKHSGLRFYVREAGSHAVAQAVLTGELELGIVTLPIELPESSQLVRVPLVADELRLILPPGHSLEGKKSFKWEQLAGASMVGFEAGSAVRAVIDHAAAEHGVALNVVMELRSIESIQQMVKAGIGIGFVSRFALREDEGLPCRDSRLSRQMAIVKRADRELSTAAAAFEKTLLSRKGR